MQIDFLKFYFNISAIIEFVTHFNLLYSSTFHARYSTKTWTLPVFYSSCNITVTFAAKKKILHRNWKRRVYDVNFHCNRFLNSFV